MQDFGVIIACHAHDYYLAKGCCASVRHFLGAAPILLLADGDFSTGDLESVYGVSVLRCREIADSDLRERSCGWGLTKMIAHWLSPWPRFLLLDADTVVWGDVSRLARFDAADIVVDCHLAQLYPHPQDNELLNRFLGRHRLEHNSKLHAHLRTWYFDAARLARYDPAFPMERSIERLFCSGALLARRGVIDRETYLACLDAYDAHPGLFAPGEMGILNYLVFAAEAAGRLRVLREPDLQTMAYMTSDANMVARFAVTPDGPPAAIARPTVLHWSGWRKPLASNRASPMTFFRRKFLLDRGSSRAQAAAVLAAEDCRRLARFHGLALLDACIGQGRRALARVTVTRGAA